MMVCFLFGRGTELAVRSYDCAAIPAMGKPAVLLLRDLYQLVEEEIAKYERQHEERHENGQSPVGDWTQMIIAPRIARCRPGALFLVRCH